jgi:hypothetical protein
VVYTGEMKRESLFGFGRIEFALPEMETINKPPIGIISASASM